MLIKDSKLENLVLFRHGKAQRPFDAIDDFSRDLVERGKSDSYNQALRLNELGFIPDIALVSSAHRAKQTWEKASEVYKHANAIITRDLYLAAPQIYLDMAINSECKNVLLIAHDPGLHDLCRHFLKGSEISSDAEMLLYELPTSGIAWFKKDLKERNSMRLLHHLRPIKSGL